LHVVAACSRTPGKVPRVSTNKLEPNLASKLAGLGFFILYQRKGREGRKD